MSFLMVVVGVGLLQLWSMLLLLGINGKPIEISDLLGDGGTFFFSTSLSVGCMLNLFDARPVKIGNLDFNFTFICCGGVVYLSAFYYAAVLSRSSASVVNPFGSHIVVQIACISVALAYWFYVGLRIGLFVRKHK